MTRKYAHLLDIDDSPEIYESPELDASQSVAAGYASSDDQGTAAEDGEGIERSRLRPDEARDKFNVARVDASNADFSDRLAAKKESYVVTSRRRLGGSQEQAEAEDDDLDLDDEEGLARRIARLNREVEEVRSIIQRRNEDESSTGIAADHTQETTSKQLEALSRALDTVHESQRQAVSAHALLAQQLATPFSPRVVPHSAPDGLDDDQVETGTMSKIAAFETRLSALESALGHGPLEATAAGNAHPIPIMPTLALLDQQVNLLSSTGQVPQLEAKLASLRSNVPQANGESDTQDEDNGLNAEDVVQLRSLYALVPTITNLGPTVPGLLSRLNTLRFLHGEAARSGKSLDDIEQRQAETEKEIKAWRTGLERLEEAVKQAELGFKGNMGEVEGWVAELEKKLKEAEMS